MHGRPLRLTESRYIYFPLLCIYVFIYMLNTDVKRQRYLSEAWFTARLALCPNMAAFNVIIPPHSANTLSRHYYYYSECKFARDRAAERACAGEPNAHWKIRHRKARAETEMRKKRIPLDSIQFLAAGATIQESFRVCARVRGVRVSSLLAILWPRFWVTKGH